ncbi:MAG: hypothetical protein JW751_24750 [Polyangiaceae bacterium]|nr:hypothetical protein [Polyangiaceae bacterium]
MPNPERVSRPLDLGGIAGRRERAGAAVPDIAMIAHAIIAHVARRVDFLMEEFRVVREVFRSRVRYVDRDLE